MNSSFPKSLADWRHDLRTPAGHITGYAEMIEEELEGEEHSELRGQLVLIHDSGAELVELIDEYFGPDRASTEGIDYQSARDRFSAAIESIQRRCAELSSSLESPDLESNLPDLDKIQSASVRIGDLLVGVEDGLRVSGYEASASVDADASDRVAVASN